MAEKTFSSLQITAVVSLSSTGRGGVFVFFSMIGRSAAVAFSFFRLAVVFLSKGRRQAMRQLSNRFISFLLLPQKAESLSSSPPSSEGKTRQMRAATDVGNFG